METIFNTILTDELLDMLQQLPDRSCDLLNDLARFTDISQTCNCAQQIHEAVLTADVAHSMADYIEAVVLGCSDTALNVINIVQHPITYVSNMACTLMKITKHVGLYPYNCI